MTPEDFAAQMRALAADRDIEKTHGLADDLLCEVLRVHGYGEGVDVFDAMDKWYG